MAIRIVGVDLPQNKRGEIALTYIFGIGRSSATKILDKAGVDRNIKVKDWSDDQAAAIREVMVVRLLEKYELTIATAESCTGGLLSAKLINVPGVSETFREGFVVYSNKAKRKTLNVSKSTLKKYGAVSKQTAKEMAMGAVLEVGTDTGLAITGIAGPDGGTPTKPVGLVYIACCVNDKIQTEEYHFTGTRKQVREEAVSAALNLLRKCILEYFE